MGAGSRAAAAGVLQRPASPDVNVVLVSAADWGAVGSNGYSAPPEAPVAVHKPSDKQIKEEFGRTTFLPKIRSPVQTLRPPKSQPASTSSLKAGAAAPAAR
ncbi:hypothetical protein OEZ86_006917 [Tetradesmus obliquus]|nr:hypothetical protein OEZ86_006917 [Tetradesmus obliquus]